MSSTRQKTYGTRYFKAKIMVNNILEFATKWLDNSAKISSFKRQYVKYKELRGNNNVLENLKKKEVKANLTSALYKSGFGDF